MMIYVVALLAVANAIDNLAADCKSDWCSDTWNGDVVASIDCQIPTVSLPEGTTCSSLELDGENWEEDDGICAYSGDRDGFTSDECTAVVAGAVYSETSCDAQLASFNLFYGVSSMECDANIPGQSVGIDALLSMNGCCTGGSSGSNGCICADSDGDIQNLATAEATCDDEDGETMTNSDGDDVSMTNGYTETQCTQMGGVSWEEQSCGYLEYYFTENDAMCGFGTHYAENCCGVARPTITPPTIPAAGALATMYYYDNSKCSGEPIRMDFHVLDVLGACGDEEDGEWEKITLGADCDSYTMQAYDNAECTGTPVRTETGDESCKLMENDSSESASDSSDEEEPQVWEKYTLNGGSDMTSCADDEAPQTEGFEDSVSVISLTLVMIAAVFNL